MSTQTIPHTDAEWLAHDIMTYLPEMDQVENDLFDTVVQAARNYDAETISEAAVLRALSHNELDLDDLMALLSPAATSHLETMAAKAQAATRARFGNAIHMFSPLYIANYCENGCVYCGFNCKNKIRRARLTQDDIIQELDAIAATGIQEVLILTGESPRASSVAWIGEAVALAAQRFRTVGLEIYPCNTDDYRHLHACGADFITIFQETYDPRIYTQLHPRGNKRIMPYRFYGQYRALSAGFRGAGFGALLGLGDFRKDALATAYHVHLTQAHFPDAELAISIPRLRPYLHRDTTCGVTERELLQVACAFRLFLPQCTITLSSRERAYFRDNAIGICTNKVSAGSQTGVGGYSTEEHSEAQFDIDDNRSVRDMHEMIVRKGLQPVYTDFVHV